MIFFDTSYLVRLYFEDRGWEAVRNLAASDAVACAAHGQVEVVAAFHRKLREKAIDAADYTALLGQFELELKEVRCSGCRKGPRPSSGFGKSTPRFRPRYFCGRPMRCISPRPPSMGSR